jgi:hypothetical protein
MTREPYPNWYHRIRVWGEMPRRGRGGRYRVKGIAPLCGDCDAKVSVRQVLKRETRQLAEEAPA